MSTVGTLFDYWLFDGARSEDRILKRAGGGQAAVTTPRNFVPVGIGRNVKIASANEVSGGFGNWWLLACQCLRANQLHCK
jgi:hypothetical protein